MDLGTIVFVGILALASLVLFIMITDCQEECSVDNTAYSEWSALDCRPSKHYVCPNHGSLLMCEIDEGGACLVCKDFFLVVPKV